MQISEYITKVCTALSVLVKAVQEPHALCRLLSCQPGNGLFVAHVGDDGY